MVPFLRDFNQINLDGIITVKVSQRNRFTPDTAIQQGLKKVREMLRQAN
jgi:hypothetical protein